MFGLNLFLLSVLSVINISYGEAPSLITKCKADDSKCIKESTKAIIPLFALGLPQYNVEQLDPLFIKSINATEGNLIFLVNDATVTGLKNCEAKRVLRDTVNSKILLRLLCTCKLDGQYVLKGSVLVVPLEGNGKIHVDLNSAVFDLDFNIVEKESEDGSKKWVIKSWSHTFDLKSKSNVVFENLYDGNEILGRAAREVVANNGNDIIKEIGVPVIKAVVSRVVKNINHFFKANNVEDLSL